MKSKSVVFGLALLLSTSCQNRDSTGPVEIQKQPNSAEQLNVEVPSNITDIDNEIKDFEQKKKTFQMRAAFCSDKAERMLTVDWLSYRQSALEAQRYNGLVQEIDQQINLLKQKRQQLLSQQNK